jgi:hypothetical protein
MQPPVKRLGASGRLVLIFPAPLLLSGAVPAWRLMQSDRPVRTGECLQEATGEIEKPSYEGEWLRIPQTVLNGQPF